MLIRLFALALAAQVQCFLTPNMPAGIASKIIDFDGGDPLRLMQITSLSKELRPIKEECGDILISKLMNEFEAIEPTSCLEFLLYPNLPYREYRQKTTDCLNDLVDSNYWNVAITFYNRFGGTVKDVQAKFETAFKDNSLALAELFLLLGADPNQGVYSNLANIMREAIQNDDLDGIKLLLKYGGYSASGDTTNHLTQNIHVRNYMQLASKFAYNFRDSLAVDEGLPSDLNIFANVGSGQAVSPLQNLLRVRAYNDDAKIRRKRIALRLLNAGANYLEMPAFRYSAVYFAVQSGSRENLEIIYNFLVESRACPSELRAFLVRALFHAIEKKSLELVMYAVERGANVNGRVRPRQRQERNDEFPWRKLNWSSLHMAAYFDTLDIAQYLTSRGARLNDKDISERTPARVAFQYERFQTLDLLLNSGASPWIFSNSSEFAMLCLKVSAFKVLNAACKVVYGDKK